MLIPVASATPDAGQVLTLGLIVGLVLLPGVRDRIAKRPESFDHTRGFAAVHLRAVEELAHGWDLARATGQRPRFPHEVVARELEFCRDKLPNVPPDQSPFAPPQPVPDHAPPLDRLAALLGRRADPRP